MIWPGTWGRCLLPALCLCVALLLPACGDDSAKEEKAVTDSTPDTPATTRDTPPTEEKGAIETETRSYLPASLKEIRQDAPATEEEVRTANAQLAYANGVMDWQLSKEAGYALWLYLGADFYLREAALPKLAKRPPRFARDKALLPPAAWPKESAEAIRQALREMDAAVDAEREQYEKLIAYALDETIVDDGKQGRQYLNVIRRQWEAYEAARRVLRGEVESGAIAAEAVTLKGHPLRSQILAVRILFRRMKEARALLGEQEADKQTISAWRDELEGILSETAFLPFGVAGEPERLWRAFLRTAQRFPAAVALGEAQGFHPEVRKQLNAAYTDAEKAYNDFVDSVR